MAKRRNENGQMRREEYEAAEDRDPREDDTVVGFGMTRASDTEISKRRIVMPKGKRAAPAQAAPAAAPASSNPFSGFTGLTQAAPAPSANPFSGFTGLTNTTPAAKPVAAKAPAVPLSNDWVKTTTSGLSRDAALGAVMEVLNKEFFAFVSQQVVENPMTFWTGAVQDYIRHAHELEAKVTALHAPAKEIAAPSTAVSFGATSSGFSVGVAPTTSNDKPSAGFSFGAAAPSGTTSSPAKPATTTGFSFGAAAPSGTTSSPAKPATTTGFSFGAAAPSGTTSSPAKPATTTGFSFGASATPASPAKPATSSGFTFGSTTTTSSPAPAATTSPAKPTSSFTFGATPAASASTSAFATAPASFSFSGAPAPAPSSFAFNLPKATPAPAATEDEDDENIGREEATVIIKSSSEADETVLYEVDAIRIRHFKKDEARWADIGRHPFKILQNKTTKASRILSRNSIGKIVINAALYKGLEVTVTSNKKSVMLTLLHDGEPTSMLLGIAADRVEELKAKIEGACPQ